MEAQNTDRYNSKASGSFMSVSTQQDKNHRQSEPLWEVYELEGRGGGGAKETRFLKGRTRGKKRRKEGGRERRRRKPPEGNKQPRRTCSSSDHLSMENDDHFSARIIKTDFPRPHTLKDRALINYTPRID